jgi:PhoH-like ATPase
MPRKNYVIDTSVFAHDPQAIKEFKGSDVIIPITVLDELDKIKKLSNAAGKNARVTIRLLDAICATANVTKPIRLDGNINLRIDSKTHVVRVGDDASYGDNKILACAQAYRLKFKDRETVLVSRDINLRIRAKAIGLGSQNYEKGSSNLTDLYTGYQTIVDTKMGVTLRDTGFFDLQGSKLQIQPNECVQINDESGLGIAIGRRIGDRLRVIQNQNPWGLEARNREQSYAINMLLDPKLPLVSLIGLAGSGKTLISVGAALEMVLERKKFDKLIVYRPIQPMGNDIGYLPGSLSEKLEPWMGAVMDSFEYLFSSKSKEKWQVMMDMYCEKGRIEMNALTYIRGRSIPNAMIIIDECQNLSKDEVKTILTRAGHGTKIVLTGDIEQIDSQNLDAINNGLTYVVEKFRKSELSGHVTFSKGERSPLATEAATIL